MAILQHRVVLYQYDTETIASIFDSQNVEYTFNVKPSMTFEEIIAKSKKTLPAYEIRQQEMEIKLQSEIKARAYAMSQKQEAEEAKFKAEMAKAEAVAAKTKAETDRDQAIAKAREWQDKLAEYLTGGVVDHVSDETILLYAEWQEGLSVDAGDWYRVGLHLVRAKVDHVTAPENAPESEHGAEYWEGVPFTQEPTVKYPKGKVIEWSGVQYKALVDTDKDPGEAPESWELVNSD